MRTEIQHVEVPASLSKEVGRVRRGTRSYYREGDLTEAFGWYKALKEHYGAISPGDVSLLVGVSRNAVYKRIKQGRLTAFFYTLRKRQAVFRVRRGDLAQDITVGNLHPRVQCFIPFAECESWRTLVLRRKQGLEVVGRGGGLVMMMKVGKRHPRKRGQRKK